MLIPKRLPVSAQGNITKIMKNNDFAVEIDYSSGLFLPNPDLIFFLYNTTRDGRATREKFLRGTGHPPVLTRISRRYSGSLRFYWRHFLRNNHPVECELLASDN
jgi:hypothetical protein